MEKQTRDKLNKHLKVAKVPISISGTGVLSWQNPESRSIIITRIIVDVTTASTGSSTIDIGTTSTSATTSSDNLIDGVSGAATGLFDNITNAGTNGKGMQKVATGKWVTGTQASGAVTGLVGNVYIYYNTVI